MAFLFPAVLAFALWLISTIHLRTDDHLILQAQQEKPTSFQVFYDIGKGFNETDSVRIRPKSASSEIKAHIPFSATFPKALRIDPTDNSGTTDIQDFRVKYKGNFRTNPISLENLQLLNGIRSIEALPHNQGVRIQPQSGNNDPYLLISEFPPAPNPRLWILKSILLFLSLALPIGFSVLKTPNMWPYLMQRVLAIFSRAQQFLKHWNQRQSDYDHPGFTTTYHAGLVVLLLGFLFIARWYNIPLIGSYGDDSHKWLHAKMLVGAIPLSEWHWDHHTARLTIMLATWLVQLIFGWEPMLYYIAPFMANIGIILGLYWLGCRILHPAVGFLAGMWTILWSPFEFYQLMPSPFVALTLLGTLVGLFYALEDKRSDRQVRIAIILAALSGLFAYFAWIGSLFFMPAIALILLKNRGWKATLLFVAILLVGYLVETLLYWTWAGITGGRLAIIMANHMESVDYQMHWMDLFRRYQFLPGAYKTTILSYFATLPIAFLLFFFLPKAARQYIWIPVCFFFFLTFCIKSVNPLSVVLQHHQPRYAYPALPFVFFYFCLLGIWFIRSLSRVPWLTFLRSPSLTFILCICFAVNLGFETVTQHDPNRTLLARSEQLQRYDAYCKLAQKEGFAFVEMDNPYSKGIKFYLDILYPRTEQTPTPTEHWLAIGERLARVLLPNQSTELPNQGKIENFYSKDLCLFLYQMPFRVAFGTLSGLGNDRYGMPISAIIPSISESPILWELKSHSDPRYQIPAVFRGKPNLNPDSNTSPSPWRFGGGRFDLSQSAPAHWGSWDQGRPAKGALNLECEVNPNSTLLRIPLLTGTNAVDLSLHIKDSQTDELITSIPSIPKASDSWVYLDIPKHVYEGRLRLSIEIEDQNMDPEGWLAVGELTWIDGIFHP